MNIRISWRRNNLFKTIHGEFIHILVHHKTLPPLNMRISATYEHGYTYIRKIRIRILGNASIFGGGNNLFETVHGEFLHVLVHH